MSSVDDHSRSFHNDGDTPRLDGFLNGHSDLLCQALLNLQPAAERFGYPSELRDPEDKLVGNVPDVDLFSR